MTKWNAVETDAPAFARRVRALFDSGTNKTMATLRSDGSPRISGIELEFSHGTIRLGLMPNSAKLADVERDPRVAIHSPTLEPPSDPELWDGEGKLSGTLVPIPADPEGPPGSYFELDLTEVVLVCVEGGVLVIESWHPDRGWEVRRRS
jgi:hypothetical protein